MIDTSKAVGHVRRLGAPRDRAGLLDGRARLGDALRVRCPGGLEPANQ
jgi:hypothetical protein